MQEFLVQNYLIITTIVIVILSALSVKITIRDRKNKIESEFAAAIKKSSSQILQTISPRVVFCSSIEQVRTEAAIIISDAAKNYSDAIKRNSDIRAEDTKGELEELSQYFVTIYGAASLVNESEAGSVLDDNTRAISIKKYTDALESASESKLQLRRYVSLLRPNDLKDRSPSVRDEYVDWLYEQRKLLKKDPNYVIITSPRAPQWGSSNTSFISNSGLVEIKGHGNSAFAIYDERIAGSLRNSLRKDINDAMPQNRMEINVGNHDRMEWLNDFIANCEKEITELRNEKESKGQN